MSITDHQKELVQQSFSKVAPIADQAAEIFYTTLFEYAPELRSLFKADMHQQGQKLMTLLAAAVKGLDQLDELAPVLHALAERHVGYGVKPEHYTPVGNALLATLKIGLGNDFTKDVRQAWVDTFRMISSTMKAHAYPPQAKYGS